MIFTLIYTFQNPFDPDEFVERLAWRSCGGIARRTSEEFDPMLLYQAFERTISDLKDMSVRIQKNVAKLEEFCQDEEKTHWNKVSNLQRRNEVMELYSWKYYLFLSLIHELYAFGTIHSPCRTIKT